MSNKKKSDVKFYHLVQPYFFAHHHFHKRKIDVLRESGFDAKLLSVVPKSLYNENYDRYSRLEKNSYVELIVVPSSVVASFYLFAFILQEILKSNKLSIHVLRSSPWPIVFFKVFPFFKSKLYYFQEFEGDSYSEFIYSKEYCEFPRPPEKPSGLLNKVKSNIILNLEKIQVLVSDGLILMSDEHVKLWSFRLKKSIKASLLPTLADPKLVWFDQEARAEIRNKYQMTDSLVLTYTGNVICHWQRREEMCRLIKRLSSDVPNIRFMAIVRSDDLVVMQESIKRHGIVDLTILLSVDHGQVYKYLSAADLALFLRHEHTMNKVVTSGKLGEYLSAGLPVLTTGSNADVLNKFIRSVNAGCFIDDSLEVNAPVLDYLYAINKDKDNLHKRRSICNATHAKFGDLENPFDSYAQFVKAITVG